MVVSIGIIEMRATQVDLVLRLGKIGENLHFLHHDKDICLRTVRKY